MTFSNSGAPRRARGFTMIELVVVMAVLGLLLTLAMPRYMDSQVRWESGDSRWMAIVIASSDKLELVTDPNDPTAGGWKGESRGTSGPASGSFPGARTRRSPWSRAPSSITAARARTRSPARRRSTSWSAKPLG